jgi:hypothetical protein
MPSLSLGLGLHRSRVLTSGGAAVPFSPSDLSDLSLWLKADAGVNQSNGYVNSWADQSGNNNNASVENFSERPQFFSSFSNNKPAIYFNSELESIGRAEILQIADSGTLDINYASIFIVLKRLGNGQGHEITFMKNGNSNDYNNPGVYWQVGNLFNDEETSFFAVNANEFYPDQNSFVSLVNAGPSIMNAIYSGSTFSIYSNGYLTAQYTNQSGIIATSTGTLQIGGYNKSFSGNGENPGEYFNGQIAEFIIYNRAVTNTERQQVEAYLMGKYAIAQPSGIPVASTASIVITGSGGVPSGTYNKKSENSYIGNVGGSLYYAGTGTIYNLYPDTPPNYNIFFLLGPFASIIDDGGTFLTNGPNWQIYNIFDDGDGGATYSSYTINASPGRNYIPTSSWSPSITIAAA